MTKSDLQNTPTTPGSRSGPAFATLRFAGNALDPEEISRILGISPTHAYRKGESFSSGPRTPRVVSRTGVWYLSTDRVVSSPTLADHLQYLVRILVPEPESDGRLRHLREVMQRARLEAHVTCFWRGGRGEPGPTIPPDVAGVFGPLPADIETDFGME
jgi:hypothetical protein